MNEILAFTNIDHFYKQISNEETMKTPSWR